MSIYKNSHHGKLRKEASPYTHAARAVGTPLTLRANLGPGLSKSGASIRTLQDPHHREDQKKKGQQDVAGPTWW